MNTHAAECLVRRVNGRWLVANSDKTVSEVAAKMSVGPGWLYVRGLIHDGNGTFVQVSSVDAARLAKALDVPEWLFADVELYRAIAIQNAVDRCEAVVDALT